MFALEGYTHAEAIANLPLTGDMQPSCPGGLGFYLNGMLLAFPVSCLPEVSSCCCS